MAWGRGRKEESQKPSVPLFDSYEVAVGTAMEMPGVTVGCGAVRVSGYKEGGCALWLEDRRGGIGLAVIHFNQLQEHLGRVKFKFRLDVRATVEGNWYLPGGIRRRTPPEPRTIRKSFTTAQEALAWRGTQECRSAEHSFDFRWFVYAIPRGARRTP